MELDQSRERVRWSQDRWGWGDTWGLVPLPVGPCSRHVPNSLSPSLSASRRILEYERAVEQKGGGLLTAAQEGNDPHPTPQLTAR